MAVSRQDEEWGGGASRLGASQGNNRRVVIGLHVRAGNFVDRPGVEMDLGYRFVQILERRALVGKNHKANTKCFQQLVAFDGAQSAGKEGFLLSEVLGVRDGKAA